MRTIDVTGQQFGYQTVLSRDLRRLPATNYWEVECVCGKVRTLRYWELRRFKSCGCKSKELISAGKQKHGCAPSRASGRQTTAEYRIWQAMLTRVRNPRTKCAARYIERGITVCDRWLEFANFLADMGVRPTPRHSIDRIDNDGPYSPGNCRWASDAEQSRNQRSNVYVEFDGRRRCIADWASELSVSPQTLYSRAKAGWPAIEVLFGRKR